MNKVTLSRNVTPECKIKRFIFVYSCSDLHVEQFHCKITETLYTKPLFAAYLILCRLPFLPSGLCRRQTAKPSDTGNGIAAGKVTGIAARGLTNKLIVQKVELQAHNRVFYRTLN